uniref:Uncharacterized protein n=1 Tax=Arundo donax TaxID=35708 RepID=A0A0A9CP40_ARUDO
MHTIYFFVKSPSSPAGYFSTILTGSLNSLCGQTFDSLGAGLASNWSRYSLRMRNRSFGSSSP